MSQMVQFTLPSPEESAAIRFYEQARLRWVKYEDRPNDPLRLQEGVPWRSDVAYGMEWFDVPIVTLPTAPDPA